MCYQLSGRWLLFLGSRAPSLRAQSPACGKALAIAGGCPLPFINEPQGLEMLQVTEPPGSGRPGGPESPPGGWASSRASSRVCFPGGQPCLSAGLCWLRRAGGVALCREPRWPGAEVAVHRCYFLSSPRFLPGLVEVGVGPDVQAGRTWPGRAPGCPLPSLLAPGGAWSPRWATCSSRDQLSWSAWDWGFLGSRTFSTKTTNVPGTPGHVGHPPCERPCGRAVGGPAGEGGSVSHPKGTELLPAALLPGFCPWPGSGIRQPWARKPCPARNGVSKSFQRSEPQPPRLKWGPNPTSRPGVPGTPMRTNVQPWGSPDIC